MSTILTVANIILQICLVGWLVGCTCFQIAYTNDAMAFDLETETVYFCQILFGKLIILILSIIGLLALGVKWYFILPIIAIPYMFFSIELRQIVIRKWFRDTIGEPDNIRHIGYCQYDE